MKILAEEELSEFKSLLKLLDDDDDSITTPVISRLVEKGESILPLLESYAPALSDKVKPRIQFVYDRILSRVITAQAREFRRKYVGDPNLEEGALLISKFGGPNIDISTYSDLLNSYASELDERIDLSDDPGGIIENINRFFYVEKGFSGNKSDYYDPNNHFLHKVLERKIGVPITLCVMNLIVAWKLNVPVQGIGLPGHFIIRYDFDPSQNLFVDPFNGGSMLTTAECEEFVTRSGHEFKEEFLRPITNARILERMLRNLIVVYERREQPDKVSILLQCIDILNFSV